MLLGLAIRDIVLIDRLDLDLRAGLCALTGETGAGKSILLDSLGLALGARADAGLVRAGAQGASVTASFDPPQDHPARAILREQGMAADETLVLRRLVGGDGRSRAFVNDEPVSVGLLRRLGATLVEIHGQNDEQGLLDAATHRALLDAFGGLGEKAATVRTCFAAMRTAATALADAEAALAQARHDEEYLRHVVDELEALAPEAGEEEILAERRTLLMQGEKLATALNEATAALEDGGGAAAQLRSVERVLQRFPGPAGETLEPVLAALERAQAEVAEVSTALALAGRDLDLDPAALDRVEERLFALRAAARKHGCTVDDLPARRDDYAAKLQAIDDGGARLVTLTQEAATTAEAYRTAAEELSAARVKAAGRLDKAVAKELPPLKLGAARFRTEVFRQPESDWSAEGIDRVAFEVATNPGSAPGPLARIASGGELSRFMLALKVVLAHQGSAPTLVFDEADRGIGGATADAVGERLARLAEDLQVLVVTHSPQVAARAGHHWHISKSAGNGKGAVRTEVVPLSPGQRQEEIARMLAGATVTDQARAAARSLLLGNVS